LDERTREGASGGTQRDSSGSMNRKMLYVYKKKTLTKIGILARIMKGSPVQSEESNKKVNNWMPTKNTAGGGLLPGRGKSKT